MMARDSGIDAPPDPQTFSPSEFGDRLAMWLDGSFGLVRTDDGIVNTWIDRTANGNDAVATTHRPRRQLILGSKSIAAVFFDGDQLMSVLDSPTLHFSTDDYTIEVVASYVNKAGPSAAGKACLYEKTSPMSLFGVSLTGNGALGGPGSPVVSAIYSSVEGTGSNAANRAGVTGKTTGVNDAKFHLFGVRRTAIHTLEVRLDGASDGTSSNLDSADVSMVGHPIYIGGVAVPPGGATDVLSGAIAEIIAIHGSITEDELARLEHYLKGKYRL